MDQDNQSQTSQTSDQDQIRDWEKKLNSVTEANARLAEKNAALELHASTQAARADLALAGVSNPVLVDALSLALRGLGGDERAEKIAEFSAILQTPVAQSEPVVTAPVVSAAPAAPQDTPAPISPPVSSPASQEDVSSFENLSPRERKQKIFQNAYRKAKGK